MRQDRLVPAIGFFPGAPDLAVEVVSPGDHYTEFESKVLDWLRAGVRLVIVLDPTKKSATVHSSMTGSILLTIDDALDGGEVLPGWSFPLRDLFAD